MQNTIRKNCTEQGWLGVVVQDLNNDLAKWSGYESTNGVFVGGVVSDGPADRAGLRTDDVVAEFAGKPILKSDDLAGSMAVTPPATDATLTVFRNGKTILLKVVIGRFDDTPDTITESTSPTCPGMVTGTKTAFAERSFDVPCETARPLSIPA